MHTIAIYVCIYVYAHIYLCAYIAMPLHPCQFPSPVIRLSLLRVFCFMKFVAIEVFCFSIILFSHSYEQSYNHINNECNTFWPNKLSHFLVYVIFFYYCCCFFFFVLYKFLLLFCCIRYTHMWQPWRIYIVLPLYGLYESRKSDKCELLIFPIGNCSFVGLRMKKL